MTGGGGEPEQQQMAAHEVEPGNPWLSAGAWTAYAGISIALITAVIGPIIVAKFKKGT